MEVSCALKTLWTTFIPLMVLRIDDVQPAAAEGELIPIMEKSVIHMNVTEGRTAILPCMVNTLTTEMAKKYRVMWLHPKGTIMTFGTKLLVPDRRMSVVRPFPTDWNLRINRVRGRDAGTYLCQLNTEPQQQKTVTLYVQVPPDITSSKGLVVAEGQDVKVYCNVTGTPTPTITWSYNNKVISELKGEVVTINNISRQMAGVFTCRASNGVKPNVTKNVTLDVQFPPKAMVYSKRIGQYRLKDTVLGCVVVAYPPGEITWYKKGKSLRQNWKYDLETVNTGSANQRYLQVKIRSLQREDYGEYTCVAQNGVGESEVSMILYELKSTTPSPSTTQSIIYTRARTTPTKGTSMHGGHVDNTNHEYSKNIQGGYRDRDGVVIVTDRTGQKNGQKSRSSTVHSRSLYKCVDLFYVIIAFVQFFTISRT